MFFSQAAAISETENNNTLSFTFHTSAWFVLEKRLNGQRQQPGEIQSRHNNSGIE